MKTTWCNGCSSRACGDWRAVWRRKYHVKEVSFVFVFVGPVGDVESIVLSCSGGILPGVGLRRSPGRSSVVRIVWDGDSRGTDARHVMTPSEPGNDRRECGEHRDRSTARGARHMSTRRRLGLVQERLLEGWRAKRPGAGLAPSGWKYEPQGGYFRSKTEYHVGLQPPTER